jgi:hypothetical protein
MGRWWLGRIVRRVQRWLLLRGDCCDPTFAVRDEESLLVSKEPFQLSREHRPDTCSVSRSTKVRDVEARAPFHNRTDDDLANALENAKISAETARENLDDLKGNRRADVRRAKADRDWRSASAQIDAIQVENGCREL